MKQPRPPSRRRFWLLSLLFWLLLFACRQAQSEDAPPPATIALPSATAVAPSPQPPTSGPQPLATSPQSPTATSHPPSPIPHPSSLMPLPPERDDVALAVAYKGLEPGPLPTPAAIAEPLAPGAQASFNILNHSTITYGRINATLQAVSDHAYFWFDTGPGLVAPDAATLVAVAETFDAIYEADVAIFGQEDSPGIDGDPRIHIVTVSPLALCDVTVETRSNCGLAGYFSAADVLPAAVEAHSNEREMFVMSALYFGTEYYLNVLGHEFRHMIEENYDRNEADWAVEGSASLAEALLGYPDEARRRANEFLQNPDQQLNRWTDGNTRPYYGQAYLLNHYLYQRLGPDLYRDFATSPEPAFAALDTIAGARALDFTGESLWLDWLAALAIHDLPQTPARYQLPADGLATAAMTPVNALPTTLETTVNQYAADYYDLRGTGDVPLHFSGSTQVALLDTAAASGRSLWLAGRANFSHARLTRAVDLRGVAAAGLHYAVYYDIEAGYDFAYVSVSTDGGLRWQGLAAEGMKGLDPADDPAGVALTPRFYTGRSEGWLQEDIDLTPYAGQLIHLRLEYITDPILTFGGIAFDDIAIPEIGFFNDAESDVGGWTAEGFGRLTAAIAQPWHLQLITFANGAPVVALLLLNDDNTARATVNLDESGGRAILIVAAAAPMTLQPADYRLEVGKE